MKNLDVIKRLAEKLGISQAAARRVLKFSLEDLETQLLEDSLCHIHNLGRLKIRQIAKRKHYIPTKKAYFLVPRHDRIQFSADKDLLQRLSHDKT